MVVSLRGGDGGYSRSHDLLPGVGGSAKLEFVVNGGDPIAFAFMPGGAAGIPFTLNQFGFSKGGDGGAGAGVSTLGKFAYVGGGGGAGDTNLAVGGAGGNGAGFGQAGGSGGLAGNHGEYGGYHGGGGGSPGNNGIGGKGGMNFADQYNAIGSGIDGGLFTGGSSNPNAGTSSGGGGGGFGGGGGGGQGDGGGGGGGGGFGASGYSSLTAAGAEVSSATTGGVYYYFLMVNNPPILQSFTITRPNGGVASGGVYIGEKLTLSARMTDVDSNLVQFSFWWDAGVGNFWTNAAIAWNFPANSTGWSNFPSPNFSPTNDKTITANWTPYQPGLVHFHSNGNDALEWGLGITISVPVKNNPTVTATLLDASKNALTGNTIAFGQQFYVRVAGNSSNVGTNLGRLYSRIKRPDGTTFANEDQAAPLSTTGSIDFGPYTADTVGSWTVFGQVSNVDQVGYNSGNDLGWATTSNSTLTVTKASATISLGSSTFVFDGSAKSATYTTSPSGLAATITYNGSSSPPVNGGTYVVAAQISDPSYQGTATGSLTINMLLTVNVIGGNGTSTGSGQYAAGATANVVAIPDAGWGVQTITGSGYTSTGTTTGTVAMISTANQVVSILFKRVTANLTVTFTPGGGSATGGGTYFIGDTATITPTPAVGYYFSGYTGDLTGDLGATDSNPNPPGSITMTGDKAVMVVFAQKLAQTITVVSPLPGHARSDGTFSLAASASTSSGLPVIWQYVSGPATLSGTNNAMVTLAGIDGTVVVQATQPGSRIYLAAPSIETFFTVTQVATNTFQFSESNTSSLLVSGKLGTGSANGSGNMIAANLLASSGSGGNTGGTTGGTTGGETGGAAPGTITNPIVLSGNNPSAPTDTQVTLSTFALINGVLHKASIQLGGGGSVNIWKPVN
jgi:hypothetical protein